MKGKRLFYNTIIMTVTSMVLRIAWLIYQVFLSQKMGAAGIGLYSLIFSVNSFAATVAISGVRFATTRLVSEEIGRGRPENVKRVVTRGLIYATVFGTAAAVLLFGFSGKIGAGLIGDERTILSLRILAVSLPFLSCGAVLTGYFTGVCRAAGSSAGAISEQVFKIGASVLLLNMAPAYDVESMCAAAVTGNTLGEILSFLLVFFIYLWDRRRYTAVGTKKTTGLTKRMVAIAAPLAVSAWARTALNTLQNMLIPRGFKKSGKSAEAALADYGTIQGMVFPIITFPSVLFSAVSELIVPELTEEQVQGKNARIERTGNMLLKLCLVFSVFVMGVIFCFSKELGMVIYKSISVGGYLKLLAFLTPIMYLDTITDGMLRGLGQQVYSMKINIIDSLISTALVWLLLPRYAVLGYIAILYLSEGVNFFFSMKKLKEIAQVKISFADVASTLGAAFSAGHLSYAVMRLSGGVSGTFGMVTAVLLFLALYVFLAFLFGAVKREDILAVKSAVK